jgi:hypothetical protein
MNLRATITLIALMSGALPVNAGGPEAHGVVKKVGALKTEKMLQVVRPARIRRTSIHFGKPKEIVVVGSKQPSTRAMDMWAWHEAARMGEM